MHSHAKYQLALEGCKQKTREHSHAKHQLASEGCKQKTRGHSHAKHQLASAKVAAQKLNQAASPSNPGRASPQELFTGKKSAFLVVPFFQYGSMYRERRSKLDDKAVPCYFSNAGDNHAECCIKVLLSLIHI